MTATGLESNGYLIDNDIWVNVSSEDNVEYYTVNVINQSTQESTGNMKLYPRPELGIKFNLSPAIKGYFPRQGNDVNYTGLGTEVTTNWQPFRITIGQSVEGVITTQNIDRNFIKGGNETLYSNQHVAIGDKLRRSDKLPIWAGYPVAEYSIDNQFRIVKNTNLTTVTNKDFRTAKGCDPVYLKFRNSLGGYSYWLFEGWSEPLSNTSKGIIKNNQSVFDLGSDTDNRLSVYSKVPASYYGLIDDLIKSSEIYTYDKTKEIDEAWEQIQSVSNKTELDHYSKVYEVKLNFNRILNYNPSQLWSN
jgi:hypothetical protein